MLVCRYTSLGSSFLVFWAPTAVESLNSFSLLARTDHEPPQRFDAVADASMQEHITS